MDGVDQDLDIAYKRDCDHFFQKLKEFHKARGTPFLRVPTFGGQPLDLYALYNTVISFGGICVVTDKKKWGQVFRTLGFPPCTNAAYALKQHYARYLEAYEKIFFLGEDTDDSHATRTYTQSLKYRRLNKAPKLGPLGEPLVDNFNRISFSLQSGLQNEVDFALNICSLLSNVPNSIFNLAKSPTILDLMLGHVGIYSKDEVTMKQLIDDWYSNSDKDFVKFWRKSLNNQIARDIYEENNLDTSSLEDNYKMDEKNTKLFISKEDIMQVSSPECCRINQVCIILYNFSFEQMNAMHLSSHDGAIRFLLLAACCIHSNIQRTAIDALDNISNYMTIRGLEDSFTQHYFQLLNKFLVSNDKLQRSRAMSILAKLASKEDNKTFLTEVLSEDTYKILIETLYLPDIALILASLDTLYCFTNLNDIVATGIAMVHGSIDVLVCLITVRAETYGNKAIKGYRIIENKLSMFTPKNQLWMKSQEDKQLAHQLAKARDLNTPVAPTKNFVQKPYHRQPPATGMYPPPPFAPPMNNNPSNNPVGNQAPAHNLTNDQRTNNIPANNHPLHNLNNHPLLNTPRGHQPNAASNPNMQPTNPPFSPSSHSIQGSPRPGHDSLVNNSPLPPVKTPTSFHLLPNIAEDFVEVEASAYAANWMSGFYEPHPSKMMFISVIYDDYARYCEEISRKGILSLEEFTKVLRSIIPPHLAQILPPDRDGKIGISGIIRRRVPLHVQNKYQKSIYHGENMKHSLPGSTSNAIPLPAPPLPAPPLPAQLLPSQPLPTQPLPAQSLPPQTLPPQTLPAKPLPTQPLPAQPLPAQPLPTHPLPTQPLLAPPPSDCGNVLKRPLPFINEDSCDSLADSLYSNTSSRSEFIGEEPMKPNSTLKGAADIDRKPLVSDDLKAGGKGDDQQRSLTVDFSKNLSNGEHSTIKEGEEVLEKLKTEMQAHFMQFHMHRQHIQAVQMQIQQLMQQTQSDTLPTNIIKDIQMRIQSHHVQMQSHYQKLQQLTVLSTQVQNKMQMEKTNMKMKLSCSTPIKTPTKSVLCPEIPVGNPLGSHGSQTAPVTCDVSSIGNTSTVQSNAPATPSMCRANTNTFQSTAPVTASMSSIINTSTLQSIAPASTNTSISNTGSIQCTTPVTTNKYFPGTSTLQYTTPVTANMLSVSTVNLQAAASPTTNATTLNVSSLPSTVPSSINTDVLQSTASADTNVSTLNVSTLPSIDPSSINTGSLQSTTSATSNMSILNPDTLSSTTPVTANISSSANTSTIKSTTSVTTSMSIADTSTLQSTVPGASSICSPNTVTIESTAPVITNMSIINTSALQSTTSVTTNGCSPKTSTSRPTTPVTDNVYSSATTNMLQSIAPVTTNMSLNANMSTLPSSLHVTTNVSSSANTDTQQVTTPVTTNLSSSADTNAMRCTAPVTTNVSSSDSNITLQSHTFVDKIPTSKSHSDPSNVSVQMQSSLDFCRNAFETSVLRKNVNTSTQLPTSFDKCSVASAIPNVSTDSIKSSAQVQPFLDSHNNNPATSSKHTDVNASNVLHQSLPLNCNGTPTTSSLSHKVTTDTNQSQHHKSNGNGNSVITDVCTKTDTSTIQPFPHASLPPEITAHPTPVCHNLDFINRSPPHLQANITRSVPIIPSTTAISSPRQDVNSPTSSLRQRIQPFIVPSAFPFMQNNMVPIQHGIPNGSYTPRFMSPPCSPVNVKGGKGGRGGKETPGKGGKKPRGAKTPRGSRGKKSLNNEIDLQQKALMNGFVPLANDHLLSSPFQTAVGTTQRFPSVNSPIIGQCNTGAAPGVLRNPFTHSLSPEMIPAYPFHNSDGKTQVKHAIKQKFYPNMNNVMFDKLASNTPASVLSPRGTEVMSHMSSSSNDALMHTQFPKGVNNPANLKGGSILPSELHASLQDTGSINYRNMNGNASPDPSLAIAVSSSTSKPKDMEKLESAPKKIKTNHIDFVRPPGGEGYVNQLKNPMSLDSPQPNLDHVNNDIIVAHVSAMDTRVPDVNIEKNAINQNSLSKDAHASSTPTCVNGVVNNLSSEGCNSEQTKMEISTCAAPSVTSNIVTTSVSNDIEMKEQERKIVNSRHNDSDDDIDFSKQVDSNGVDHNHQSISPIENTNNVQNEISQVNGHFSTADRKTILTECDRNSLTKLNSNLNSDVNNSDKNLVEKNISIPLNTTISTKLAASPISSPRGSNTASSILALKDEGLQFYGCNWESCRLPPFINVTSLLAHMIQVHAPIEGQVAACKVPGCSSIKKPRRVMISHFQEKHCLKKNKDGLMSSVPLPKLPSRTDIWKFGDESPVTRSVRHTAALILRNIARFSSHGRKLISPHEEKLALVAISSSEAATAAAQCLLELSNIPEEVGSDGS